MSSSIWMQCAGESRRERLDLVAWRVVEAQHRVSTRALVDTAAEQELLETLLERVKPPAVAGMPLHYLLATPFRYPPLRHGSRFGTRAERGIWYGATTLRTALAEVAYYRLLFVSGTHASLPLVMTELTAFSARTHSDAGIDLGAGPFVEHRAAISSPVTYVESQPLGTAMRASGVTLFLYRSARDPDGGTNVGAFTPAVFGVARPKQLQRWHCTTTAAAVEFVRTDLVRAPERYTYTRDVFEVDGVLPQPGV